MTTNPHPFDRTDLIVPTTEFRDAWRSAHTEWGPGEHEDGFGLLPTDDVDSTAGFDVWVQRLTSATDTTYRWILADSRVAGGIALRHHGDVDAGHIGFGIAPSARRRGLATWALDRMLAIARDRGMRRILLVCAADNTASARTIERCGGVFEAIRDTELGPAQRYWIDLARK